MKNVNSIEAYDQKKALEALILYSDFNTSIDIQIYNLRKLYANCPENWIVENIARSVAGLMSIKDDMKLAHERSIEIMNTPFLDESELYTHHH